MLDFLFKDSRRAKLREQPLSEAQRAIIAKNVPYLAKLPEADQKEIEGLVQIFLAEREFEGCGGLELNDEIKVTIAAQACLLLLHRENDDYPGVDVILVYPSAYRAKTKEDGGGFLVEGEQARLGESWTRGVIVLAAERFLQTGSARNSLAQSDVARGRAASGEGRRMRATRAITLAAR